MVSCPGTTHHSLKACSADQKKIVQLSICCHTAANTDLLIEVSDVLHRHLEIMVAHQTTMVVFTAAFMQFFAFVPSH